MEKTRKVVYQGYEPIDIEIDRYGNLFFLDKGAGIIGKIPEQNLLFGYRSFDLLYSKQKTVSLTNINSMAFDQRKQFLYWSRNVNESDGLIYKAFSESFVIERPFEKLECSDGADLIYAIDDHVYYATNSGEIYMVRYKLSNTAIKVAGNIGTVTDMLGYKDYLLVADSSNSVIYQFVLYADNKQEMKKVIDPESKIEQPLGIFAISDNSS